MYLSNPGLTISRLLFVGALGLFVPGLVEAQPTTTRVSVGPGGLQANETSWVPAISADGRWVAFESGASNLVAGDTNGARDVFVHDRQTGTTTRVSVGPGGTQANGPDAAGSRRSAPMAAMWRSSPGQQSVAGDTNGVSDVFVHDRQTGTTTRVSVGPGGAQAKWSQRCTGDQRRWPLGGVRRPCASNLVAVDTNGT